MICLPPPAGYLELCRWLRVVNQGLAYHFRESLHDKYRMRNFIDLIVESYLSYPAMLNDAREIAQYIDSVASDYVDIEMIEEYFNGAHAVLRFVPIENIHEGDKNHNIRSKSKERKYSKMDPEKIPPLVLEHGIIMDGNHRYRVAKKNGATGLWCYVIED